MKDVLHAGLRWATRASAPPPRPSRRNLVFDAVLALSLAAATAQYALAGEGQDAAQVVGADPAWSPDQPTPPPDEPPPQGQDLPELTHVAPAPPDVTGTLVVALIACAALVLRRRYPLAVLWAVLAATLVASPDEPRLTFFACVIAAYSAAAYSPYRAPALLAAGAAALVFSSVVSSVLPVVRADYVPLAILVPVVMAADGLRRWKLRADARGTELAELERRQAEALQRAAQQERTRIARELHDVVTHNVSVMVIQAGAARKVMAASPDDAGEALLTIEEGGRTALAELRQVMGLLTTSEDGEAADLAPQPGLSALSVLVDRVREAGVDVEFSMRGRERPLPAGVELTAYRVAQEALTNTMKHAAGAAASVTVACGESELRVEVADTGGDPAAPAASGDGRGLIGLRERVASHGGTLHTGPRPTGGFRVTATLPAAAP